MILPKHYLKISNSFFCDLEETDPKPIISSLNFNIKFVTEKDIYDNYYEILLVIYSFMLTKNIKFLFKEKKNFIENSKVRSLLGFKIKTKKNQLDFFLFLFYVSYNKKNFSFYASVPHLIAIDTDSKENKEIKKKNVKTTANLHIDFVLEESDKAKFKFFYKFLPINFKIKFFLILIFENFIKYYKLPEYFDSLFIKNLYK